MRTFIILALLFSGIFVAGNYQNNSSEVKSFKTSASQAPTIQIQQSEIPTPTPIESVTPYFEPTETTSSSTLSNNNYYTNSRGNEVHSPAYSDSIPEGASALCGDGTYSFSQSRRGTCSHHGGVATWY